MLESKPIVPIQPSAGVYGPESLQLFKRFNRDTYLGAFGVQAPPFNVSKPVKRWFDTEVLSVCVENDNDPNVELVQYSVFDRDKIKKINMTVNSASEINLPGLVVYPKFVPVPTLAKQFINFGSSTIVNSINVLNICSYEEAVVVAATLGLLKESVSESRWETFGEISWNGETRRPWLITFKGSKLQAAFLLQRIYSNGVGAPGKWDMSSVEPVWVSDLQVSGEQVPVEVPIPVRALASNERIKVTPFAVQIYRTDVPNLLLDVPLGGLTPEQASAVLKINDIAVNVQKLVDVVVPRLN